MGNLSVKRVAVPAEARARRWLLISTAAIGWALFTLVILHAVAGRNPVTDTLSSYAHAARGTGMLEASLLSLAVGAVGVLVALRASGLLVGRTTHVLFGLTALGLTLAALFPATLDSGADAGTGLIHQYASLIAFLCLPGIAYSLLDRLREIPDLDRTRLLVTRILVVNAGSLALFGISYFVGNFPDNPVAATIGALLPVGFTQRITLISGLTLLVSLNLVASRTAKLA